MDFSHYDDTPTVKLRVFDTLADQNLKQLMNTGLCVTVNTDDPAYFGGYVAESYLRTQEALNLGADELCELARNSFAASSLDDSRMLELIAGLDAAASGG